MRRASLAVLLSLALAPAWCQSPKGLSSRAALPPAQFQSLLQKFVDKLYLKAFRHLGDERDFDHGHVLYSNSGAPAAILYHTQELAYDQPAGSDYGYLDAEGRNWIQWIDTDSIENASCCVRSKYPETAFWDWFRFAKLPALLEHHTILDKMLDPERVGAETMESAQWAFRRVACGAAKTQVDAERISVRLPGREDVCLDLSAT
ncbi:MAG: hypothetical protein HY078_00435 [Elusimicrobia bacterium]|nr:hypothetical protein [Elusimicrobiota bacterium]